MCVCAWHTGVLWYVIANQNHGLGYFFCCNTSSNTNLQPIAYSNLTTDSTRLLYLRPTEASSRDSNIVFHDVMRSCSTWSHLSYKMVEVYASLGTFGWLPSSLSMPWRTQVQPSPRCTLLLFLSMWSPSNRGSTRSIVILEFEVLVLDGMLSFSHKNRGFS